MTLHLHALGHFHPRNEITNALLESLDIGTSDDWIVDRVGIRARRTVLPLDYIRQTRNADVRAAREAAEQTHAQLGAEAARMALARAGLSADQVGLLICGSSAPAHGTPADASFVARELGLQALAFDVNSACSSFVTQLTALSWMDPARLPDFILLVCSENLTTVTDYGDRSTCVLFGDGAAAAVISTRIPGCAEVLHAAAASDPSGAGKVVIPRTGYFSQDGRAVQMFAIRRTRQGFEALRDAALQSPGAGQRPLHFVGHQANLRVLEQVCKRSEISPALHHSNVETRGNTGCASAPSALSMHWEQFGAQDDVALVVVGGGLSWARALLRFHAPAAKAEAKA